MSISEADRRRTLENERHEIQMRLADWGPRLERAGAPTAGDYFFPPLAGCAVAVLLFATLVMYAIRNFPDGTHQDYPKQMILYCLAVFLVVAAIVFFIRRGLRSSRIAAVKASHDMAVRPLQERLREIDEILSRMDPR